MNDEGRIAADLRRRITPSAPIRPPALSQSVEIIGLGGPTYVGRYLPWQERIRRRQCARFVRLQSNLLSQHDVAGDQMTDWRKTPTNFWVSSVVHLMHVRHNAMVDTVTLSAVAAGYLEISRGVELCALLRGEPASQKAQAASLATIFARKYSA